MEEKRIGAKETKLWTDECSCLKNSVTGALIRECEKCKARKSKEK